MFELRVAEEAQHYEKLAGARAFERPMRPIRMMPGLCWVLLISRLLPLEGIPPSGRQPCELICVGPIPHPRPSHRSTTARWWQTFGELASQHRRGCPGMRHIPERTRFPNRNLSLAFRSRCRRTDNQ